MRKRVIALGFFDGVHVGHAALINKAKERAQQCGALPALLTFDSHPASMITGKKTPLICSAEDRAETVRRFFGVDEIISVRFDDEMMHMPWESFVRWLAEDFDAVHLVAGHDYHFGWRGEGNPEKLRQKCSQIGLGCDIVPRVEIDGVTVSSTYIRSLIESGNMEQANRYLGHPHALTDTVRFGYRLGRKLGTPTINMQFADGVLVPAHGVYASRLMIEGEDIQRVSVTNVGVRPTVGNGDNTSVESYILDYDGNIYGKRVRLEFMSFIRPERKFAGMDELKAQIHADTLSVREYFEK